MPKYIALIALVALWSGSAAAGSSGFLSHFRLCIARSGDQYMVDANISDKCPKGDDAVSCLTKAKAIIHTRGRQACLRKGGTPMDTPSQNSN